jgi:ABC-type sugar transport system permease subunit
VESAKIDGARIAGIFRHVILPHLTPVISATGVITSIWTLNYFDLIWVTTKGGPMDATSTLPIYTYRLGFEFFNFGQSASLAVVSLFIISILCIPYIKSMFGSLKEEGVL